MLIDGGSSEQLVGRQSRRMARELCAMSAPTPEPRVKGVSFRTVYTVFGELRGQEALERALGLMKPELSEAYRKNTILAASWYPISWYRDALSSYRRSVHEGLELMRAIGYRSLMLDMASVYKQFVVRFLSPQLLLGFSGRLFNTYYDTGKFEVIESQKGSVSVRCSGCIGWDQNMWTEITGGSVALLELSRAKDVRLRVLSGGKDGDTTLEMVAYWSQT
jgi:hypothetical protein